MTYAIPFPVETTQIDTRIAQCYCGAECPSRPNLAFFEDQTKPGKNCADCGYLAIAHERMSGRLMDSVTAGHWPKGIEPHDFVAKTEGESFDQYYCGHAGWD